MADNTKIEWTDATWNPITGCSVVSPGCTNCYAMRLAGTRLKHHPSRKGLTHGTKAGPVWTGEVRFNEGALDQPLGWSRPRRIFVCAHGDLFHEGVEDAWINRVFAVMALCPQHTFQVLTKRPYRMRQYLLGLDDDRMKLAMAGLPLTDRQAYEFVKVARKRPLPNVWLGVSVEDQKRADERIPILLDTPAAVRWISAEPLLAPLDLSDWLNDRRSDQPPDMDARSLDWVVVGGESGPGARPMHSDWARGLRDQCADAGVAFSFKQWGAWAAGSIGSVYFVAGKGDDPRVCWPDGTITSDGHAEHHGGNGLLIHNVGKKAAGRTLDGVIHDAFPESRP